MTIGHRLLSAAVAVAALSAASSAAPAAAGSAATSYEVPPPVFDISAAPDGSLLAVGGDTVHELRRGEVSTVSSSPRGGFGLNGVDAVGRGNYWLTVGGLDLAEGAAVLRESRGSTRVVGDVESFEISNDPDATVGPRWKDPRCEDYDVFSAGPQSNPYHVTARTGGEALVADAAGNTVLSVRASGGVDLFALLTPPVDAAGNYRVFFTLPDGTDCYVQPVATSVAIAPDGAVYVGELTGTPAVPGWSRVWRVEPGASDVVCPSSACSVAFDGLTAVIDLAFGPDGHLYVLELDENGWLAAVSGTGAGGRLLRCDRDAGSCATVADGLAFPGAITFDKAGGLWILLEGLSSPKVERLTMP